MQLRYLRCKFAVRRSLQVSGWRGLFEGDLLAAAAVAVAVAVADADADADATTAAAAASPK